MPAPRIPSTAILAAACAAAGTGCGRPVMDAADADGDWDIGLALGKFTFPSTPLPAAAQTGCEAAPGAMLLLNTARP